MDLPAPRRPLPGLACLLLVLAGCGQGVPSGSPVATPGATRPVATATALWARPADTAAAVERAGLELLVKEHLGTHRHSHLDVFLDGRPVVVPAGIGIDIDDPEVKPFDMPDGSISYGGIRVCGAPCISPLHTHDDDGILHTESETFGTRTLGEFFDEWTVPLSSSCVGEYCSPGKAVAIYINGTAYAGDPREIELEDLREIAIVIGTQPPVIPVTADFSGA